MKRTIKIIAGLLLLNPLISVKSYAQVNDPHGNELQAVTLTATASITTTKALIPDNVKQILFVGDSITYFGGYVVDIQAYLSTRYPDRKLEILNFGVPSETVSGLNEESRAGNLRPQLQKRIESVLKNSDPQLVFICYGMNDGIYMPFDEARLAKFKEGMEWAHEQFAKEGAVVIHVSPPVFDSKLANSPGFDPAYNQVLAKETEWLVSQKEKGWHVIDIHTPTTNYLEEHRKTDPNFALSKDGIHPSELGHWLMAREILFSLGGMDVEKTESAKEMLDHDIRETKFLELIRKQHDLLRNARNTEYGFFRAGMKKGIPLPDAQKQSDELQIEIDNLIKAPATQPAHE